MQPEWKKEKLKAWMEAYGDAVLRTCYLYLKDRYLAEDAAQETFVKVYEHMETFRGESSEKTWITRIAVNVCKNYIRKNWFQKERTSLEEGRQQDGSYEMAEDGMTLVPAIFGLPEKYREVILLYYYRELKVKEIADILDLKEAAVLQRLKRGRDLLKNRLKEDGLWEE